MFELFKKLLPPKSANKRRSFSAISVPCCAEVLESRILLAVTVWDYAPGEQHLFNEENNWANDVPGATDTAIFQTNSYAIVTDVRSVDTIKVVKTADFSLDFVDFSELEAANVEVGKEGAAATDTAKLTINGSRADGGEVSFKADVLQIGNDGNGQVTLNGAAEAGELNMGGCYRLTHPVLQSP